MRIAESTRRELIRRVQGNTDDGGILTLNGFVGEDGKTYSPANPKDYGNRQHDAIVVVCGSRAEYETKYTAAKKYYVWE